MPFFTKYIKSAAALLKRNKVIFENFSYLTLFQVLSLIFPLITYPYLTRTLGAELYGLVITAQVLSSYCSIIVQFGFPLVSARHISIHKDDPNELSRVMSAILCAQFALWIASFVVYLGVINVVEVYREHFWLFFYSFFLTVTIFPKMSRDRNNGQFKKMGLIVFATVAALFVVVNVFLSPIVRFLIGQDIDLLPVRLFVLSPLFLGVSQ